MLTHTIMKKEEARDASKRWKMKPGTEKKVRDYVNGYFARH
jgi:hypothetical protein